jgi:hypothetical protein
MRPKKRNKYLDKEYLYSYILYQECSPKVFRTVIKRNCLFFLSWEHLFLTNANITSRKYKSIAGDYHRIGVGVPF